MREIFNFLNFGKRKKKKKEKEKRNIEVSKIFNFGNLKKEKRNIEVSKIFNFGNLKKNCLENRIFSLNGRRKISRHLIKFLYDLYLFSAGNRMRMV